MPRTDKEEIGLLKARVSQLEGELRQLRPPAPPAPPKPPAWAGSGSLHPNTGQHYSGEPTPCETVATGESWVRKHDDGTVTIPGQGFRVRHGSDGKAILPGPAEPRPIGPPRDPKHQAEVEILDQIVPTFRP
jgi:hypothetical protein